MKTEHKRWSARSILRDVATLSSGQIVAQIIMISSAIVVAHLYVPASVGVLGVATATVDLMAALFTGRYEYAALLPKSGKHSAYITVLACSACLTFSLVVAAGIGIGYLLKPFGWDVWHQYWLWLVPFGVLSTGVNSSLIKTALRINRLRTRARNQVLLAASGAAIQIGGGLLGAAQSGFLVFGRMFGRFIAAVSLLIQFRDFLALARDITLLKMLVLARKHWRFPTWLSLQALVSQAVPDIPVYGLMYAYSAHEVGLFVACVNLTNQPMSMIGASITDVTFQRLAEAARTGAGRPYELILYTTIVLGSLSIIPSIILILFGEQIFSMVLGHEWAMSGHYAKLLLPSVIARFMTYPTAGYYMVTNRQGEILLQRIAHFLLVVLAMVVGIRFFDIDTTILGYSLASAIGYFVTLGRNLYVARKNDLLLLPAGAPIPGYLPKLSLKAAVGLFKRGRSGPRVVPDTTDV